MIASAMLPPPRKAMRFVSVMSSSRMRTGLHGTDRYRWLLLVGGTALGDQHDTDTDQEDTAPAQRGDLFVQDVLGQDRHQDIIEGLHGKGHGQVLPGKHRQPEKKEQR